MSALEKKIDRLLLLLEVNDWVPENSEPLGLTKDFLRKERSKGAHAGQWKQLNSRHTIWKKSYLLEQFQVRA